MKIKNTFLVLLVFTILFSVSVSAIDYPLEVPRTLTTSSDGNYAYENQNNYFQV